MTTKTPEATAEPVEQRKPLLDLSELVDKRDFIVGADGQQYYLRTDGLGALEHHELIWSVERHDDLMNVDPSKLKSSQKKEMEQLVDRMLEIVLDAPMEVRKAIKGSQARQIVGHFQRASQPEGQVMAQLAALAEALQKSGTEPADSSTMES